MQLGFLLFMDVGPKIKKTFISLVCRRKKKQECLTSYDSSSRSEIIFKLPLPRPTKSPSLPNKTKILDLKTKHDQILKKSSSSNCLLVLCTKNDGISTNAYETVFLFRVLIIKNHFLVIQFLKCKVFRNSPSITRTKVAAPLCGSCGPRPKGAQMDFLLQQNTTHTLVCLPLTRVWAEGPLTLLLYYKRVGHPHWPLDT